LKQRPGRHFLSDFFFFLCGGKLLFGGKSSGKRLLVGWGGDKGPKKEKKREVVLPATWWPGESLLPLLVKWPGKATPVGWFRFHFETSAVSLCH
jgi:hypothetical protein